MRVIFLEDVAEVAKSGDLKEVADGYARNYLFPRKLAVIAAPSELKKLELRHQADARREAHLEQEAEDLAQKLGELTISLKVRAGAKDRIYGSVTSAAIAREVKRLSGHEIDKRSVELAEPIKDLGKHEVPIKLTKNVTARVTVLVEREQEIEQEPKEKEKE